MERPRFAQHQLTARLLVLVVLLLAPAAFAAQGEESRPEEGSVLDNDARFSFHVEKSEIPRYFLVKSFFDYIYVFYADDPETIRWFLSYEFGIEERTEGSRALIQGALAQQALNEEKLDLVRLKEERPADFTSAQLDFLRTRVVETRKLYDAVKLHLSDEQHAAVERFMDTTIRSSINLVASSPDYGDILEAAATFEAEEEYR